MSTNIYITNAFSLQMLPVWRRQQHVRTHVQVEPILGDPADALDQLERDYHTRALSAVGHPETAAVFSKVLDREVPLNRVSLHMDTDTILLVGQLTGGRLPEGATTLPRNLQLQWLLVRIATHLDEEF